VTPNRHERSAREAADERLERLAAAAVAYYRVTIEGDGSEIIEAARTALTDAAGAYGAAIARVFRAARDGKD
jgi:hypothetical protein